MTEFLLLRLEAPLMSFGGPAVDQTGRTRSFPGQAQVTGLLANALGWEHGDADRLEALQHRLRMAAALVRPGEPLRDYQTVDLGQPHLVDTGWTTRGVPESRGGASSQGTHIRYRWYLADALVLVALTLFPPDEDPVLPGLAAALERPARPLFIGRKHCLPTAPLLLAEVAADSAEAALRAGLDTLHRHGSGVVQTETDGRLAAAPAGGAEDTETLVDRRDWRNQMHTGTRQVRHGRLAWGAGR